QNEPWRFAVNRLRVLTISLLLYGCAPVHPPSTNVSPAYLYLAPSISSFQDPDVSISGFHTFSVFPSSLIGVAGAANDIMEKQILFMLRNSLEAKGYHF